MDTHILIVDDDPGIRETMYHILEESGYNPSVVASAEEAIEILKTNKFDVVITDIMMPGMNGLELTNLIKNYYDTDVVVMTGYGGDYSYEEAIYRGASDFVFKPIRFQELLLRIRRVLNERKLAMDREDMLEKLKRLAITDGLKTKSLAPL